MQQDRYLDEIVSCAISTLWPDHDIPDANNRRPDGSKHPAPDHFLRGLDVFIERKTLNPLKKDIIAKANQIRRKEGLSALRVYGTVSSNQLFKGACVPNESIKRLNDYYTNQLRKTFRSVEKKFSAFFSEPKQAGLPIFLISDSGLEMKDSGLLEYTIGRMMQVQSGDLRLGHLAAALSLTLPAATRDTLDGHWAKVLVRNNLTESEKRTVDEVLSKILYVVEQRLVQDGKFLQRPRWRFRHLIV
ncbi:MAG: hypothetical protein IPL38_10690 [Rhodobacter sp.]|mgnify:CR=1 FL=1|nr:hypothetical protein [Rhodobacter sp.]